MDSPLIELVAANVAFVGTHFAMSHPLRAPMAKLLGEKGLSLVYSLVSVVTLFWVYVAYTKSPNADLAGSGEMGGVTVSILTFIAMVFFAGSFSGNPALPGPNAKAQTNLEPRGLLKVTRHPMMWGFAFWALSHILLWANWRSVITAFAIGVLALLGAHLQDKKKSITMGTDWENWVSKTSYWPRLSMLPTCGIIFWIIGGLAWLAMSWAHLYFGGIPAGIWLWYQ